MAVKKHELVHDNRTQLDLSTLAKYIQTMNEQPNYLPPHNELIKNCQDIVKCLARETDVDSRFWQLLTLVEDFLIRIMNSVHSSIRHEIITAILDKFYSFISDPQSGARPTTSIVLIVLDNLDEEETLSAARWLVQQGDNGPAGAGLRASLSCLYRWMYEWHGTPALGDWVLAYIKALEENERFDILIEVSVENLTPLFMAMDVQVATRRSITDVVLHVLAALRESTDALDRIAPHVGDVLSNLAGDSGTWSRQLLQNLVDILSATMDSLQDGVKAEALEAFRTKYEDVLKCLERHMESRDCRFLQVQAWRARLSLTIVKTRAPLRKVGLLNLGNTCYMNSVMQALLVTRQFSTHVVLHMNASPYWSKMAVLFAKMMHSLTAKLNPDEFFKVVKPPFFTRDNQHDSSEFLGYLLELLQSYEHESDRDFDYSRPAVLTGSSRMRAIAHAANQDSHSSSSDSEASQPEASSNSRRSVSPRPGSSGGGSSSSGQKRNSQDLDAPPSKRLRINEATFLRRDSFIDSMFGGVQLTSVECTGCHASSLSRDVFRDLQLAFPEKPEGWQYNVQGLLEYYCSKERLTGDNQYKCRECGLYCDAEKSVLIETTPRYLILVLKNFKFDPKLQVQTKLMHSMFHNHTVTLPTVTVSTARTQGRSQLERGNATYSLYAAVIHDGTTLDSGHYYTLAKDADEWHLYDDANVSNADASQLNELCRSSTPYILFYRRSDCEEEAPPALDDLPPRLQETVMAHNKHIVETVRKMHLTRP